MSGVRIVKLEAEQIKRINAISIEPSGNVVVVGGKCGQGKTTALDCIWMALKTKAIPGKPVRDGAEAGVITLTLSNGLVVKKTIKASGAVSLMVTNAEGFKAQKPQEMLDNLIGSVSLDPLAFIKMGRKEQYEELARVVGLDFTALDVERKRVFDERTETGRQFRAMEGQLTGLPHHADAPAEEVSVAALAGELQAANRLQSQADAIRRQVDTELRGVQQHEQRAASIDAKIARLKSQHAEELHRAEACAKAGQDAETKLDAMEIPDTAAIEQQLTDADATNRKVRANKQRVAVAAEAEQLKADGLKLSARLAEIDADKQAQIAAAKLPLPGVSFGDEVVLLHGQPVDQAGGAEQIAFSTALTFASKPGFPVARIDHGNDLDEDGLRIVAETAAKYDGQVWMAWVGTGPEVSVVIEDGAVKEVRPVPALPFDEETASDV